MPWPEKTRHLGKPVPRNDASAKVTGKAKFTSDIVKPGMLYGAILRSKWPAARIRGANLDKALAARGIRAAITAKPLPFDVLYYGDEIAAVAGTSRQAVLDALELIQVDAETRPFVIKELDAIKPDAPRVVPDGPNLGEGQVRESGDVDAAFSSAAAVIEGVYETQIEIHHPLEAHANAVMWNGDSMTAWSSTQGVHGMRVAFANSLGVSQNNVRVICDYMGGGFGSKFNPGAQGILCARLAREAGAPVKLVLTRFEQALAVGNRPSSHQKIKMAADASGKFTAFQLESFGTPGYRSGAATGGGSGGAGFPAPYLYKPAATRIKQGSVAVNAGQSCAFRAPGHPVASLGIESAIDDLAVKLGMDPVEIRIVNDPLEIRRREYQIGAERFGWKDKYRKPGSSSGPVKMGVGCAGSAWNSGMVRETQAQVQINSDGTVEVRAGIQDLGTGSRSVVQLVAAEMLGLDLDQVTAHIGDTHFPPGPSSGGSRTTSSIAPAVYDACEKALAELKERSGTPDPSGANWKQACAKLGAFPVQANGRWREGLADGGAGVAQGGVQFAEVEVDTETGFVKVRRVLVVQDCGLVVNKLTCESQINGGVIMGVGYALYEDRVMDSRTGVVLNPNFETYKLPGTGDMPEIDIILVDQPERGVIGVGEPCTVPTASAIANAVANAIGVRVASLPITPDKVLAALGKVPGSGASVTSALEIEQAFATLAAMPAMAASKEMHA
jgi:xanthine dehydrogenase YagR molybdenum-binding subunit